MKTAVLACTGLDKPLGSVSREVAIGLSEEGCELICPVLLNNSPERYAKTLGERPLLVVDGCATRCATKLANGLGLKVTDRILIAEELKRLDGVVGKSLSLGEPERAFARRIVADWVGRRARADAPAAAEDGVPAFLPPTEFLEVTHDKFVFKVPAEGYVFNENDVWARVVGGRARLGISDLAQQQLSDINFCEPLAVGTEVDQFGDFSSIESTKATLDLVSPVAGRIVAFNPILATNPETINLDPYGAGWIAELELRDFASDRAFLLDGPAYLELVKRKAAEA